MLKKIFAAFVVCLLFIGTVALVPTERANASGASNKMLFLYAGHTDQGLEWKDVVACDDNAQKKCFPQYATSTLEFVMAKRGVFQGKEGVHEFVILGDNAVTAANQKEMDSKRPYKIEEETTLFPQAMVKLATDVIKLDTSAKIWFSLPGRGSSNGSTEFNSDHFKKVMKAISDLMPKNQWNNNVQGFYMNVENVYAFDGDPSKTKTLFRDVAAEIASNNNYKGKQLLWAPYYNSRTTSGMNNLRWMSELLAEPVFDIVLLQPNYFFTNHADDKDLKAVIKSVDKNRLHGPDGTMMGNAVHSKTTIGAVMEVDASINNKDKNIAMTNLNRYKEYVKGLQGFNNSRPFVFYSGSANSIVTGGPETPSFQSNPWQVHQYMLDFYNGTELSLKVNQQTDNTPPSAVASPSTMTSQSDISVKVTVSDPSGVDSVYYQLTTSNSPSSSGWKSESPTFQVTINQIGTWNLFVKATDKKNNTLKETKIGTYVKQAPPQPTKPKAPTFTVSPSGWSNQDVTVTILPTGNVEKTQFSVDSTTNWTDYKRPYVATSEGTHTVYAQSINGNLRGDIGSVIVKIDKTPPVVSAKIEPTKSGTFTVTPSFSDDRSGLSFSGHVTTSSPQAPTNESSYTKCTSGTSFNVYTKGKWYIHLRAKDNAGNEKIVTYPVTI